MPDPRNNADDAYEAFMSMPDSEYRGLLSSLFSGGVLTPPEQEGFDRALSERGTDAADDEYPPMLTTVTYYRIPRYSEDNRRNQLFDRDFELALRWHPFEDESPYTTGFNTLGNLQGGADISRRHLDAALAYLHDAIAFYAAQPREPYPGRNDEALSNLLGLLTLIVDPNGPAGDDTTIGRVES